MLLSSTGIVLNSTKYNDSSLITKLFTLDKGVVSIISNRGKGKTSKNSILKQPFSLVDFVCYFKQKSTVHRIKEVSLDKEYNPNRNNVVKDSISFFITEFLSRTIKEEEENKELFFFLKNQSLLLNHSEKVAPNFLLNFLVALLYHLGIEPNIDEGNEYFDLINGIYTDVRPTHNNYCSGIDSENIKKIIVGECQLNKTQRKTCLNVLIQYYSCQLQQEIKLKSQEVLEVVFA